MYSKTGELKHIGIIGGGPAGLFMYKRLVESAQPGLHISIFEKKEQAGPGMPYSAEGACKEHITNVSGNEIPEIISTMKDWISRADEQVLQPYDMKAELFNDYKVVPRLLFGEYLSAQFALVQQAAAKAGVVTELRSNTRVCDVEDIPAEHKVTVYTGDGSHYLFDTVIICTGHSWPKLNEGKIPGWFDSPYPPAKFSAATNFAVAIKGASLTAIDAVRTLARLNGGFIKNEDSTLSYQLHESNPDFKIVLHSLDGLLPGIRFHLEDTHLSTGSFIDAEEANKIMEENDGFVPLDLIFDRNFKDPLRQEEPEFYEKIKDMKLEEFVESMMSFRTGLDAFTLFKAEYKEAEKSISRRRSVYWKEMLATLSYAMNYPAKHLSAEDMLRLKRVLMPLVSIVIAFVPQSSCRELMALHDAGVLTLVAVDKASRVEPVESGGCMYYYTDEQGNKQELYYTMFIDAIGQAPVMFKDFPFKGLSENGMVSEAFLKFREPENALQEMEQNKQPVVKVGESYYLGVPGININDHFQALDKFGVYNERVYVMAVPLIAGLNPDYSGLDFCEAASARIVAAMFADHPAESV